MSVDIGAVKGLIELQDDFSGRIDLAGLALSKFTKENQESLTAVAGAAGIVAAAIGAVGAAVVALGVRGADINDLRGTIEQFTGGAREADEVMEGLRSGTMGVVDNFTLAERAAHLLSAGVKLTSEEFGTLGSAAFVMANRGLGSVEENLKLVSDAMVTGKTRALSLALGVIDAGDAEDNYAKSLGVTKEQLSDAGKAEAHRIEVMRILSKAVDDAGEQTRDFGEQLKAAQVFVTNWVDDLGSAIAASPVFAAGMKAIGDAVSEAFNGSKEDSIKSVVSAVEEGAIIVVNFGLAAIEMARVVNIAWSVVKTAILATEGVITGIVDLVVTSFASMAEAGEALHLVPEGTAAQLGEVKVQLDAMTVSFMKQADEAAKGVVGQSEFDKTLDNLGGTLFRVKDAMQEASKATAENTETTDIAANNAKKLAAVQADISKSMIDRVKIQAELDKIEKKSLEETAALWADYSAMRIKNSGTTEDYERAQIDATFKKAVGALNELDPAYKKHYEALTAVANAALEGVGSDWDSVKDKSIEGMRQQAQSARDLYNKMASSSLGFTRDALDEQLQKTRELEAAANGMGKSYVEAMTAAAAATKAAADEQERLAAAAKAIKEANSAPTSFSITRENLTQNLGNWGVPADKAIAMAKRGFSFQEIIAAWRSNTVDTWVPAGPRIPGFAQGGLVDIKVGENGPEAIRVPRGTEVFPTGMTPGGNTTIVNHYWNVNGSAQESAKEIKKILMNDLKLQKQFS